MYTCILSHASHRHSNGQSTAVYHFANTAFFRFFVKPSQ